MTPAPKTWPLNLLVAMPSEARPLLDAFKLRADDRIHGLYVADNTRLLVAGMGKVSMATAVGYLAGAFPEPAIWLNTGIAGHRSLAVGEVMMVHAAEDPASGQTWYPPLAVAPPVPTGRLVTVDQPETEYPVDAAYDMEGTAFLAAARRYQTAELVHCLKVISDGPNAPFSGITREKISAWIAAAVPAVLELRRQLESLADELASTTLAAGEELRWIEALAVQRAASGLRPLRFTVSDQRALRRELARRNALDASLPDDLGPVARKGKDVVRTLRAHLDRVALHGGGAGGGGANGDGADGGGAEDHLAEVAQAVGGHP